MISVWVFDDVWEQGYKFIDALSGRYCYVPTIYASSSYEACQFLEFAFRKIPKHDGTSEELCLLEFLINREILEEEKKQTKPYANMQVSQRIALLCRTIEKVRSM